MPWDPGIIQLAHTASRSPPAAAPIDSLDFASPVAGLGLKLGFDAAHKLPTETTRTRGRPIVMSTEVKQRVDALWSPLGLEEPTR